MIRASVPVAEFISRRLPRPLKVLESLYDSWFERIRHAATPTADEHSIGWPIASISSSAILIVAVLIINELDPIDLTTIVARMEHLSYFAAGLFVDLFALLLCAAPVTGLYVGSRRLATALASRAFAHQPGSDTNAARALIELLQVTILLVVTLPLLAIVQPFLEPVEGVGVFVISTALMTIAVTRSARRMQGQLGNAARLIAAAMTVRAWSSAATAAPTKFRASGGSPPSACRRRAQRWGGVFVSLTFIRTRAPSWLPSAAATRTWLFRPATKSCAKATCSDWSARATAWRSRGAC
jgi:CPA2 family monovalent cation:H+ antiporter-2